VEDFRPFFSAQFVHAFNMLALASMVDSNFLFSFAVRWQPLGFQWFT
jgi:hypothetical protein